MCDMEMMTRSLAPGRLRLGVSSRRPAYQARARRAGESRSGGARDDITDDSDDETTETETLTQIRQTPNLIGSQLELQVGAAPSQRRQ
jgi:hypothetical protein